MKKLTFILAAFFVFGVSNLVKAQDNDDTDDAHTVTVNVPDFAILDIETVDAKDVTLSFSETGLEAGSKIDFTSVTNNDTWLNYSALTDKTDDAWNERTVNVAWGTDDEIPGMSLYVKVGAITTGTGNKGELESTDPVKISSTSTNVIKGIGSCYTETGSSKGHQLTYSLVVDDYSLIEAGNHAVTVTYTISD